MDFGSFLSDIPAAIVLDLDGTLLNSSKKISQENKDAVKLWKSKGVHIVLASGRMTPVLENNAIDLGIDCFLMGYNGAECVATKERNRESIFKRTLPDGAIDRIIDYSVEHDHFVNVYGNGKLYGAPKDTSKHYPERYSYLNQATYDYVTSIDDLRSISTLKAIFIKHDSKERDSIYDAVKSKGLFSDLHYIKTFSHNTECSQSYIEFMHPEVNKGSGLNLLCDYLNISSDNVVALGDGDNDIELLKTAGLSICMAQGTKGAKEVAKLVSKHTNDEHGVAQELTNLFNYFKNQ